MDVSRESNTHGTADSVRWDGDSVAGEIEFWDACWTLDDEWQPHAANRRAPSRRRRAGGEARALL